MRYTAIINKLAWIVSDRQGAAIRLHSTLTLKSGTAAISRTEYQRLYAGYAAPIYGFIKSRIDNEVLAAHLLTCVFVELCNHNTPGAMSPKDIMRIAFRTVSRELKSILPKEKQRLYPPELNHYNRVGSIWIQRRSNL